MAKEFFTRRIPREVKKFNELIEKKPIVLFMLAKKMAGKSTYAGHLSEVTDDKFIFIAVGDLMREAELIANTGLGRALLHDTFRDSRFAEEEIIRFIKSIKKLDQTILYPTPYIVRMLEILLAEIGEENPGKSIIIDGLPRNVEQLDAALDLAKRYKKEGREWFFVEIDCPNSVLEARIVGRRICPICHTSRNIKFLITPEIEYDEKTGEFYLICDNPTCNRQKMIRKPGDELGIKPLAARQKEIEKTILAARKRVPENRYIIVHNAVPVDEAEGYDPKDFTQEAELTWDEKNKRVRVDYVPWITKDDEGRDVYSRYSEPVAAELIKELVKRMMLL